MTEKRFHLRKMATTALLAAVLAFSANNAKAQTWDIGTPTATDVTATLAGGTLTISGTGNIMIFPSFSSVPWYASHRTLITEVVITEGVTNIPPEIFYNCNNLENISIPEGVTSIGSSAFRSCSKLTEINIPASVATIANNSFYYCQLTAIHVAGSSANFSSIDGVLFNKDITTFIRYPQRKGGEYVIPATVTSLGYEAFGYCNITSVTIPAGVVSIGTQCFIECFSLLSITALDPVPASINTSIFYDVDKTACILEVPALSVGDYSDAPGWGEFDNINAIVEVFVAVSGITDVPDAAATGTPLLLTGTVNPGNASYGKITWSIKSADPVGIATITGGNTLNTTNNGTVIVKASIANGLDMGVPFEDEFTITVNGFTAVSGITGIPAAITAGEPLLLEPEVAPAPATDKTVAWSIFYDGTGSASLTGGNTLNTTATGLVILKATITNGKAIGTAYTQDFEITVSETLVTTYTVTFEGEAISIEPQTVAEGSHATPPPTPEREGYDFVAWFTDNGTFLNEWNFATRK